MNAHQALAAAKLTDHDPARIELLEIMARMQDAGVKEAEVSWYGGDGYRDMADWTCTPPVTGSSPPWVHDLIDWGDEHQDWIGEDGGGGTIIVGTDPACYRMYGYYHYTESVNSDPDDNHDVDFTKALTAANAA